MAKQPFVRTTNFTDISNKLKNIAGQIARTQTLGNIPQLASAMSTNEQIIKNNPITKFQFDEKMPIGGFLSEVVFPVFLTPI